MKQDDKKKKIPEAKLKVVHKVQGIAEAEIIKTFLESNGISCIHRGQVVQSVTPFTADGLGQIKILVFEKDFELAKKLLEEEVNSEQ